MNGHRQGLLDGEWLSCGLSMKPVGFQLSRHRPHGIHMCGSPSTPAYHSGSTDIPLAPPSLYPEGAKASPARPPPPPYPGRRYSAQAGRLQGTSHQFRGVVPRPHVALACSAPPLQRLATQNIFASLTSQEDICSTQPRLRSTRPDFSNGAAVQWVALEAATLKYLALSGAALSCHHQIGRVQSPLGQPSLPPRHTICSIPGVAVKYRRRPARLFPGPS